MIKLKNLWKVALATMAMTAMLVACDEGSSKKDDNKGGDSLGGTGVYSYAVDIDDISVAWGGSPESPAFSVVLLTDELFDLCKAASNFKQAPADTPEYQIGAYGNMTLTDTSDTGNFAIYGLNPVDGIYQYYAGVAAAVTDTTVTVTVDMTKLVITDLKALWTGDKEANMGDDDIVDLKGYKPYIIALSSETADPDNYCFNAWNCDVMKMEEGADFPSGELKKTAPVVPGISEMTYITSNAGNFPLTWNGDVATAEIAIENLNDWGDDSDTTLYFGITIGANVWTTKYTGAKIEVGGEAKEFILMADGNSAAKGVAVGKTYILTVTKTGNISGTVGIKEK